MEDLQHEHNEEETFGEEEVLYEEVVGEGSVARADDDDDHPDDGEDEALNGSGDGDGDNGNDDGDDMMQDEGEGEATGNTFAADGSLSEFRQHAKSVFCIAHSPAGPFVVTGGEDDRALIWHRQTGETIAEISVADPNIRESVVAVSFSFDGKFVAAGDMNGHVLVMEVATGEVRQLDSQGNGVEWIDWHGKGYVLLVGTADGLVYMWNIPTGTMMGVFAGHTGSVTAGRFTQNGKKLITAGVDGTARVWNPKDFQCEFKFSGRAWHEDAPLTSLDLKDDTVLISGSQASFVSIGNIVTGKVMAKLSGHSASVECVGFSLRQPNFVYSGGLDGTLRIWDVHSCRSVCTHETGGDDFGVTRLIGLEDRILTGSVDGVVRLWDERTGQLIRKFEGHRDIILDMVVTPDKEAVITSSDDASCRVFSLRT